MHILFFLVNVSVELVRVYVQFEDVLVSSHGLRLRCFMNVAAHFFLCMCSGFQKGEHDIREIRNHKILNVPVHLP